jgi:hypothetical protein
VQRPRDRAAAKAELLRRGVVVDAAGAEVARRIARGTHRPAQDAILLGAGKGLRAGHGHAHRSLSATLDWCGGRGTSWIGTACE